MLFVAVSFEIVTALSLTLANPIEGPAAVPHARTSFRSASDTSILTFDRSDLPKWTAVTSRHLESRGAAWDGLVERLRWLDRQQLLQAVNAEVNRARYVPDDRNWGVSDHWATPAELFERGGDCEDYAIAKYLLLKDLGVEPSRMRIAVSRDHAVLLVDTDQGQVALDNQRSRVAPPQARFLRAVVFTVNDINWSVNLDRRG